MVNGGLKVWLPGKNSRAQNGLFAQSKTAASLTDATVLFGVLTAVLAVLLDPRRTQASQAIAFDRLLPAEEFLVGQHSRVAKLGKLS